LLGDPNRDRLHFDPHEAAAVFDQLPDICREPPRSVVQSERKVLGIGTDSSLVAARRPTLTSTSAGSYGKRRAVPHEKPYSRHFTPGRNNSPTRRNHLGPHAIIPKTVGGPFSLRIRRKKAIGETQMKPFEYSADRSIHLKIVIVAIVAASRCGLRHIGADSYGTQHTQTAKVLKAGASRSR